MSAHALGKAIAVLALGLVLSCRPSLDDDLSHLDTPRIFAVQSEPAEARPGEQVALRAFYTDGTTADPPARLSFDFCVARRALAEATSLSGACLRGDEGALVALAPSGTGPTQVAGAVPGDACRLFGPERPLGKPGEPAGRAADPDVTGGYFLPGIVHAAGADDALFEVRVRCGLAGANQADVAAFERGYRPNTNPSLSEVVVVHVERSGAVDVVTDGAEIAVGAGETVRVRASWPACAGDAPCGGAERYPAFDPAARVLVTRREALRVSWLSTRGKFADARTGRSEDDEARDVETTWTAPSSADSSAVLLWIVVRDARGGTGVRALRARVTP